MKNLIQAAGFIIYKEENRQLLFLILQYNAGHWDLPKGKVEQGESLYQAATRELFEETGLVVTETKNFSYSLEYSFYDTNEQETKKKVTLFLASCSKNSISLSHEHSNFGWLSYHDALVRLTYLNAREALEAAYAYISTP